MQYVILGLNVLSVFKPTPTQKNPPLNLYVAHSSFDLFDTLCEKFHECHFNSFDISEKLHIHISHITQRM